MKQILPFIVFFSIILFSCGKPDVDISGTYSGEIEAKVYANDRITEKFERFKINIIKNNSGYFIEDFPALFNDKKNIQLVRVSHLKYTIRDNDTYGSGTIRFITEPTLRFSGEYTMGGFGVILQLKLNAQKNYTIDYKPD